MNRTGIFPILSGDNRSPLAGLARAGLALLTPGYRAAVNLRNGRFDAGARRATPLGRPTISVGNLTTGGTGKTPMVIDLCRRLEAIGQHPAVLLRGYKSAEGRSDEAEELRAALPSVAVVPNPSRIEGARQALADSADITCLVLDDGFQHRQAARDLDLVLIDATNPWGFGHLLPRGLLREPEENLARADAVIVTRADQVEADTLAAIDREVVHLRGEPPAAHTAHVWTALHHDGADPLPIEHLQTRRVFAASAIGNPAAFERTLAAHCREIVGAKRRDDHHAYTADQIADLLHRAKRAGADAVVTTEKDYVKWRPLLAAGATAPPILRPALGIGYLNGEDGVATLLRSALDKS